MKDTYITKDDCELYIEYSVIEADPSVGIAAGYSIAKITLNECQRFKDWRKKFKSFKDGYASGYSPNAIQEHGIIDSEDNFEFQPFEVGYGFVSPGINKHVINLLLANRIPQTILNHSIEEICDYVFADCCNTDVTDLFDHLEIEQLIKDQNG